MYICLVIEDFSDVKEEFNLFIWRQIEIKNFVNVTNGYPDLGFLQDLTEL